jgi:lytic murein transglycosylase
MLRDMRIKMLTALGFVLLCGSPSYAPASAQTEDAPGFQAYLQLLAAKARSEGVSEATIQRVTADLTPNPRVIALDQSQPGSGPGAPPPMAPYIAQHVDAARISRGRAIYDTTTDLGARLQGEYGVPLPVLLAIWGHETNYGSYTGDFDLARSLATLAWEGRRRDLFESEFIDLLKIVDRGIPPSQLKGSWAGAFGNPQFLPSVYLRLARDEDGDGRADIWNSRTDTLASIANYFRDAGWRRGQPWGVAASVPAGFDAAALRTRLIAPQCPAVYARHSAWRTIAEWRALGVTPQAPIADSAMATLFEPDGRNAQAYLLTGNYRVILEYNCSNYYAMSVGLLADAIAR